MSQKLGPRAILKKPVTRGQLIEVLARFEQQIDRKIWIALPWYVKLWRSFFGKRRAARRQVRTVEQKVAVAPAREPATSAGERKAEAGG